MKSVQINQVCGSGSTGRIALDISKTLDEENIENWILYGYGDSDYERAIKFGGAFNIRSHQLKTRLLGKHGFYSKSATKELVKKLEAIDPDIIHLHNLHGHYLNVELLFNYLSEFKKPVIWTLHDCWSFTGHCAYFDYVGCEKWRTGCYKCPNLREYPRSLLFDRSKESYRDKKRIFNSIENLSIVAPSEWLAGLARESFLGKYPVKVIYNGIDLDVFKPTESNFRQENGLQGKFVMLGVANVWERRKGYSYFLELSKRLKEDERIVLLGLDESQKRELPNNILAVEKTSSQKELAKIYSAVDLFVNPTLEEVFGLVNAESLACGTPVVTFNTGGSPEAIDEHTGIVVEKGNLEELVTSIEKIKTNGKSFYSERCINRVRELFEKTEKYKEYVSLYREINVRAEKKVK